MCTIMSEPFFVQFNTHLTLEDFNILGWKPVTAEAVKDIYDIVEEETEYLASKGAGQDFIGEYKAKLLGLDDPNLPDNWAFLQSATLHAGKRVTLYYSFTARLDHNLQGTFPDKPVFHARPGSDHYGSVVKKKPGVWSCLPIAQAHQIGAAISTLRKARAQGIAELPDATVCWESKHFLKSDENLDTPNTLNARTHFFFPLQEYVYAGMDASHLMDGFPGSKRNFNPNFMAHEHNSVSMSRISCRLCAAAMAGAHLAGPLDLPAEQHQDAEELVREAARLLTGGDEVLATCQALHRHAPCRFWNDAWGPIPHLIKHFVLPGVPAALVETWPEGGSRGPGEESTSGDEHGEAADEGDWE